MDDRPHMLEIGRSPVASVTVRAPATSANVGPGFDSLGVALNLHNTAEMAVSSTPCVEVHGEGAGALDAGSGNLIYRAAMCAFEAAGTRRVSLHIRSWNRIPLRRGLGSSAAAIALGLVGANRLLGDALTSPELLDLACGLEGHPDNVAPALRGGFQVSARTCDGVVAVGIPPPIGLSAVVCIPDLELSTQASRDALPSAYSRTDAVHNISRSALLVAALCMHQTSLLRVAMDDRVHQPYRSALIPGFDEALKGAYDRGALGACLSGSGSSVLAFTQADHAGEIGDQMVASFARHGLRARWMLLSFDPTGTTATTLRAAQPARFRHNRSAGWRTRRSIRRITAASRARAAH